MTLPIIMSEYEELIGGLTAYLRAAPENRVAPAAAIRPELAGMPLFADPLFAVGDAADPLYSELKAPAAVHPEHLSPAEWMPEARTVIAVFFPLTERIRQSNRGGRTASDEWRHGKFEGQDFIKQFTAELVRRLEAAGHRALSPEMDPRFRMITPLIPNWSLRHSAYICGLGTFGLSKSLITAAGCAGRLASVVTDAPFPVTARPYRDRYAYCTRCGKCARNCPVHAIDPAAPSDLAKNNAACQTLIRASQQAATVGGRTFVRNGCGKCQTDVPCMDGIPGAGRK